MMDYLRAGVALSAANLPRQIAKRPYEWLFAGIKALSGLETSKAWLRNSLALDYWELGLSDLDLSVWTEGNAQDALLAWRQIAPYEKLLIGGEVQVYSAELARKLCGYANPWEIRRDPNLLKRLKLSPSFANPMHLTVFLVRMLQADKGLMKFPQGRQRKWREHLQAMQLPVPGFITWDYLVELLQSRAPFSEFTVEELHVALVKTGHDSFTATALDRLVNANHHVWDDIVRAADQVCWATYTPAAFEFITAMVEWEIWGVSSLTPLTKGQDPALLPGFWWNQRRLIGILPIDSARRTWLEAGITSLEAYYSVLIPEMKSK